MDFAMKTNPFGAPKKKEEPVKESAVKRQRSRLTLMKLEAQQRNKERGKACQKLQKDY